MKNKYILLSFFLTSLLGGCELPDIGEKEATEEGSLSQCLESLKTPPEIKIAYYTESSIIHIEDNGSNEPKLLRHDALDGRLPFLIEKKKDFWRYSLTFEPIQPLNDGIDYPMEGSISYQSDYESGLVGIEFKDSVYYFVNPEEGNEWFYTNNFLTSTSSTPYKLTVVCECENGEKSEPTEVTFTSAATHEIFQGHRLRTKMSNNKLSFEVNPFSDQHQMRFYPAPDFKVYAITKKTKNSTGEVDYQYQYDYDLTKGHINELPEKSFTELTGLPESWLNNVYYTIQTEIFAEYSKTNQPIGDSPVLQTWPHNY